jgi:molybdopterin synthase catalytic subunit
MNVRVLFFAQARERAGVANADLSLPEGSRVEDALAALARDYPALAPLWPTLAVAVSGKIARRDAALGEGAEVALLPPVSGG